MAESKGAIANVDMDSLLDGTLDDLKDLPEFKAFPPGAHKARLSWEVNKEEKTVKLTLIAIETMELADASKDQVLEPGTETVCQYKLDNEFGQGNYKNVLNCLATIHGPAAPRALMDASQKGEYIVITDVRKNKDKTQSYTDVKSVAAIA